MAYTVDFWEVSRFPKRTDEVVSMTGIRRVRCAWDDAETLKNEMLSPVAGNNIWPWPYHGASGATVVGVAIEPFPGVRVAQSADIPGIVDLSSYEWALLTIKYSTAGPVGLNLWSERLTPFLESQRMTHEGLNWENVAYMTPLTAQEAPHKLHAGLNYDLTRHKLASIPNNLQDLIGFCNANTYQLRVLTTITFGRETLLYRGSSLSSSSSTLYDVTMHFTYKLNNNAGWNGHWRMETGQYERIFDNQGGIVRTVPMETFPDW